MIRVGVGGLVHETNTYATDSFGPTGAEAFRAVAGDQLVRAHLGTRTCIGGMLDAAAELGFEVVPLWWASAEPSGTIERAAYESMRTSLVDAIADALPLDALALDLHGAGVFGEAEDLEVDLGLAVRAVAPDLPVVVTLDLHGNIADEMTELYDVMLGYHLYPHTDMWERGDEAIRLVPRLLAGEVRPTAHVEHVPVLLPTSTTDPGFPAADMNEVCRALEERPGVIDCTVFHGFPFTDIAGVGVHVVVTTDDDPALAREVGAEVGRWVWDNRERFRIENPTPEQAVQLALQAGDGLVVINETSDNPGGGSPGDGTHLLRALLDAGAAADGAAFGFLCDPETVRAAHDAGVGAAIDVRLGGHHDELHGAPIETHAYVKCLTDGRFVLQALAAGSRVSLGRSARLVLGADRATGREGIDVIVTERRSQTLDDEIFRLHGIDVTRRSIVALKSSNHFRAGFRHLAARIVTADSPGLTTCRVEVFPHPRSPVPLWPQDPRAAYQPSA